MVSKEPMEGGPKVKRIRIIQASKPYWYEAFVGREHSFLVYDEPLKVTIHPSKEETLAYLMVSREVISKPQYIEVQDCEIIGQTIEEWAKNYNLVILDPDGFDRKNPNLWKMIISKSEFAQGVSRSTCKGNFSKLIEEAEEAFRNGKTF